MYLTDVVCSGEIAVDLVPSFSALNASKGMFPYGQCGGLEGVLLRQSRVLSVLKIMPLREGR